jgi:acetolactate synthase-1/2/3 large subunit
VREFAEKAGIPVAMTLLGIGRVSGSHPLNLGMMGMHGEAWVNQTIQEADLLLAFGMRFDDRVTGNLKTYASNAQEDSHRDRSRGDQQERESGCAAGGRFARSLHELLPQVESIDRSEWLDSIDKLKGDAAVRDIQNLPDSGHLVRRACDQRLCGARRATATPWW